MKKTLLALAVSALSANAFAASLDYSVSPVTTPVNTIAKEVVGVSGAALTTTDTIKWKAGFSTTNQNLVRIDLSNGAKFTASPSLTLGTLTSTVSAGGLGQSFVVFQLLGAGTEAAASDVTLTLAGLTAVSQSDIGLQYRLYSTQSDAANATAATIATGNFAYATFANGLVFGFDAAGAAVSKQIDVAQEGKRFVAGLTSVPFGGLNLSVKPATYGTDLATPLTLRGLVGTAPVITVSGDFSAAAAAASLQLGGITATGLAANKQSATFTLPDVAGPPASIAPLSAAKLTYIANGTTAIAPSSFNAKLALGTGATLTAAPAEVTGFANLAKNGATQHVDLVLKPGGAYANYVRISNNTGVAGDVFITVINDAGARQTVNLSNVAGQTSNVLTAGASTTQMDIQSIFNAAEAKGLALSGEGKLRLLVEAQIPEGGLSVQTYTTSKDANNLNRF